MINLLHPDRDYHLEVEWYEPGKGERSLGGVEVRAGDRDVEIRLPD